MTPCTSVETVVNNVQEKSVDFKLVAWDALNGGCSAKFTEVSRYLEYMFDYYIL
jgi:hypothetical protein